MNVFERVQARATWGATGLQKTDALVLAQGRGVQFHEPSCHTDDVECVVGDGG